MASPINDYIAGAIGGMAGLVVGHPLDTTKVQLQTKQTSGAYRGSWHAMKHINRHGMVRGFFRGMGFPLVSYGVVNSVFFGVYGNTLQLLQHKEVAGKKTVTYGQIFLAGCAGGAAQLVIACPIDVVKVVLQSQIPSGAGTSGGKYFRGPMECLRSLYEQQGIRGCYRGFLVMTWRDVVPFGVYTLAYESLYVPLSKSDLLDRQGVMASLISGGWAGCACWTMAMPFDVVKSMIQADPNKTLYSGSLDCSQKLYKKHGIKGFFTGLQVTLVRAFIVNSVTFLLYSKCLQMLNYS